MSKDTASDPSLPVMELALPTPAPAIGWEEYFRTNPPPSGTEDAGQRIDKFISFHAKANRRVVLVTSGGTTVPLEKNTVRFIDNFSAGTRGATSAEYFIEAGYAVIFMHRQFSLQPYSRHYTHSKNCFLDYMQVGPDGSLTVDPKYSDHMREVLGKYQKAKQDNLLIMESFVTVEEYLFLLRRFTTALSTLRENALYYLAAAVSDFFVPPDKMTEHKIQSSGGCLELQLDQVPKVIYPLVDTWASRGFIVSFKLETDPSILIPKSRRALERYKHQLVIGNILSTRKRVVTMVTLEDEQDITLSDQELAEGVEIESRIIPDLVARHDRWIKKSAKHAQ
ncbi:phosphopantothenate---cysteine ligase (CTP) [Powellomyces hirtus]|uniref:Phosphopantothenate---cysteine ligase (CTP) n=1 Tax=Powellomyces hirtus TaxID=109895 RepID=A0A507E109_9FUNG|nr:phosphopantothenate---cysteine ligase (CTP) [Powellomyces hirtus]